MEIFLETSFCCLVPQGDIYIKWSQIKAWWYSFYNLHKCVYLRNWQGYLRGWFRDTRGIANDREVKKIVVHRGEGIAEYWWPDNFNSNALEDTREKIVALFSVNNMQNYYSVEFSANDIFPVAFLEQLQERPFYFSLYLSKCFQHKMAFVLVRGIVSSRVPYGDLRSCRSSLGTSNITVKLYRCRGGKV